MKLKFLPFTQVVFLFSILFLSNEVYAQPGAVDLSFNPGTGIDEGSIAGGGVKSIAIQSDGRIILGGNFETYNKVNRNRILRISSTGTLDASFDSEMGASNDVTSVLLNNSKIIMGGYFTNYNGTGCNRVASINNDGSVNTSFVNNNGINPFVSTMAAQLDGKIILGGKFSAYNMGGPASKNLVRVNEDGTQDMSFNVGTGANDQLMAMAFQNTGKLIIVGVFTAYNGTSRKYIARVNSDGTLDASFDPQLGPNNQITAIAIQDDGKIIIGGWFSTYNGSAANRVARLNLDGSIDNSFNVGVGPNNPVSAIAIQGDGKVIIGGNFTSFAGVTRRGIARLKFDGSLDAAFDPGYGVNGGNVQAIAIQGNGRILIGGLFTSYDQVSRNGIARILVDGASSVEERKATQG
jgi:uncharacterized delta-60 repeat protein